MTVEPVTYKKGFNKSSTYRERKEKIARKRKERISTGSRIPPNQFLAAFLAF